MPLSSQNLQLHGVRGATTSISNSTRAIETAVNELVSELVSRNDLIPERIISITFSVTSDLDACFPASIARKQPGWETIALLDCQQMAVAGDLSLCIRMMALVWLPLGQMPQHPYLGEARKLRPDR